VSTGVVDTVLEYEMRGFEMLEFACEVPLAAPPEWKQGLGTHLWECLEPQVDRRCTAAAMLSLEWEEGSASGIDPLVQSPSLEVEL